MTNPYSLQALVKAREEDIRRSALGRHYAPRRAHRLTGIWLTGLWAALPKRRRPFRRSVALRVVPSPLETTNCRG